MLDRIAEHMKYRIQKAGNIRRSSLLYFVSRIFSIDDLALTRILSQSYQHSQPQVPPQYLAATPLPSDSIHQSHVSQVKTASQLLTP